MQATRTAAGSVAGRDEDDGLDANDETVDTDEDVTDETTTRNSGETDSRR
ncbi:hypothetical protein [Salinigranum salinum]|nr:hypothetical protein [Salinigranum salinum]